MNEATITIAGNVTADPDLRFTPAGNAVLSFTVAQTSRFYDKDSNGWRDGKTLFMRCNAWRVLAENVAATIKQGMRVTVTGDLEQRSFETREGEKRTVVELRARDVAVSLLRAQATVRKMAKVGQSDSEPAQYAGNGADVYEGPWGDEPPAEEDR